MNNLTRVVSLKIPPLLVCVPAILPINLTTPKTYTRTVEYETSCLVVGVVGGGGLWLVVVVVVGGWWCVVCGGGGTSAGTGGGVWW